MSSALKNGELLEGRYRIEQKLGEGSYGAVYLAKDLDLDRQLAIKVLSAGGFDQETIKRFEREARMLSELLHPNIVRVFRMGYLKGKIPFLAMELVDGISLRDLLRREKNLNCQDALLIMKQLSGALGHAHAARILHRDLKPENILLLARDGGFIVKLADFGLGKQVAEADSSAAFGFVEAAANLQAADRQSANEGLQRVHEATLTRTGSIVGTPLYMSPEQCMGKPADQRSDIYAFGCILYEMITGESPFLAANPTEILLNHINKATPKLLDLAPGCGLPIELQDLILKATDKRADKRFQTCRELELAIDEVLQLNCKVRFPQGAINTAGLRTGVQSPLKKAAIWLSFVIIPLVVLLALRFFKISLHGEELEGFSLDPKNAVDSIEKISIAFKKSLHKSSTDPSSALRLVDKICASQSYKQWNRNDRVAFLSRINSELASAGMEKVALKYKLLLLVELLEYLQTEMRLFGGDKPKAQALERLSGRTKELNGLCRELTLAEHTRLQWTEISRTIEIRFRPPLLAGLNLDWLWALRCTSLRHKGMSGSDSDSLAKLYLLAADSATLFNDQEALKLIVADGDAFARSCGALNRAKMLHLYLGQYYLKNGLIDLAKEELSLASRIHDDSDAKVAEAQARLAKGCKLGTFIEKTGSGNQRPRAVYYEKVLGQDGEN